MERRDSERFEVWFPVQLQAAAESGKQRITMSRDVSARGILLSAATKVEPGAKVVVTFRILPDEPTERTLQGRIVRVESNTDDVDGLWPLRLAVEFDEPVFELAEQLAAAEELRKHYRDE